MLSSNFRVQTLLVVSLMSAPLMADGVQTSSAGQAGAVSPGAQAGNNSNNNNSSAADSPAEQAYKQQLIQVSQAIDAKISEIQAKQKELDEEIYPASRPPLQADLNQLNQQLQTLQLQRDQLQAQKTVTDMSKQLNSSSKNQSSQ